MIELHYPAITLMLFFASGANRAQEAQTLCHNWQTDKLTLKPEASSYDHYYVGYSRNGFKIQLTCHLVYDTHVLRLACSGVDEQISHSWQEQEALLQEMIKQSIQDTSSGYPWGMTWLYHAVIPTIIHQQRLKSTLAKTLKQAISEISLEKNQYGWLTLLKEERETSAIIPPTQRTHLTRHVALITTEKRSQQVETLFLAPMTKGFSSVELYLHKGTHHLHQYNLLNQTMEQTRREIERRERCQLGTNIFCKINY